MFGKLFFDLIADNYSLTCLKVVEKKLIKTRFNFFVSKNILIFRPKMVNKS
jgi:hypothetical protein